jgi:hypothetical protein
MGGKNLAKSRRKLTQVHVGENAVDGLSIQITNFLFKHLSFGVDENGCWKVFDLVGQGDQGLLVGPELKGQTQIVDEIPGVLLRVKPHGNEQAEKANSVASMLLPGGFKIGHFFATRRTGRIPEVEHHGRLTSLVGKLEIFSVKESNLKVGGWL